MDMEEEEDAKNSENKSEADQMGTLGLCAMQDEVGVRWKLLMWQPFMSNKLMFRLNIVEK